MQYNDYIEKYDPKIFEKMSKEYSQKYQNNAEILSKITQKNEQKRGVFLQKYEAFLEIILSVKKQKNSGSFLLKNAKDFAFEKALKNCCKLYKDVTGKYIFSPNAQYIAKTINKNALINNAIKDLFFTLDDGLNASQKNFLFDNIFELIFLLKQDYFS